MKHLKYLFLVFTQVVYGQYTFDFENDSLSDWYQFPNSRWEVLAPELTESSHVLHHAYDNTDAGVDCISRNILYPELSSQIRFSFRIRHGYNPSKGNNWQFFMLSNDSGEAIVSNEAFSAFLFGVNYNCSDDLLKLWQVINGEVFEVLSTRLNYQDSIGTSDFSSITLERSSSGEWFAYLGKEETKRLIGSGAEYSALEGKFMGFRYSYSSAQDRKFWMDDIEVDGRFYKDTIQPYITRYSMPHKSVITLDFSEEFCVLESAYFEWNAFIPDSIQIVNKQLMLYFPQDFPNREDQYLAIQGIADSDGNLMKDSILVFRQNLAEFGDVIINELMTDPEPKIYLPASEYIELYNSYSEAIDISDWTIQVNTKEYFIEEGLIDPDSYLLLTTENSIPEYGFENCIQVLSSSSTLPNSGARLLLFDHFGRLIHRVKYKALENYDGNKAEGGWSLEIYDRLHVCGGDENWRISTSWKGGTPGEVNSITGRIIDKQAPYLKYLGMGEDGKLVLNFSEPLRLDIEDQFQITLNETQVFPVFSTLPMVSETIEILTNMEFRNAEIYTLQIKNLYDCADNQLQQLSRKFEKPELVLYQELLINEVMYDPFDSKLEYIELYNKSENYLDAYDLKLKIADEGSISGTFVEMSQDHHLICPDQYLVLCKDEQALRTEWSLGWAIDVLEVPEWKYLPNTNACITLGNRAELSIDNFCYHDTLHHDYLADASGVSLERIHHGTCKGGRCWSSASSAVNYGTPGVENSQFIEKLSLEDEIKLLPEVFSPDMDGFEDILQIHIPIEYQGSIMDVKITDLRGLPVLTLIDNGLTGRADFYNWDGLDTNGNLVLPGMYIVHFYIKSAAGMKHIRKVCAVKYR